VQHVRQRVDEAGLADTRNALEQHVAAREQRRDGVLDDLLVADDALADLARDADEAFPETVDMFSDRRHSHLRRIK
jgi:hypothetical protein